MEIDIIRTEMNKLTLIFSHMGIFGYLCKNRLNAVDMWSQTLLGVDTRKTRKRRITNKVYINVFVEFYCPKVQRSRQS